MASKLKRTLTVVAAAGLAAFAMSAHAGRVVLIDIGTINFPNSGQKWNGDTPYSASTTGGSVPFALNVGTGTPLGGFTFDPHGQVVFGNGFVIAPLFSSAFFPPAPFVGSLGWGSGQIDAQLLAPPVPNPVYVDANLLSVFRFTWQSVCTTPTCASGSPTLTFQALLVDRGNGDFDLDFNYNPNQSAPAGATAGYALGSNVASFAGPYSTVGPDYCFRGGVGGLCGAGVVTPIPEPTTNALMLAGLAALVGGHRWRRLRADRTA